MREINHKNPTRPHPTLAADYSANELIVRVRLLRPDAERDWRAARLMEEMYSEYIRLATIEGGEGDETSA